MPSTLIYLLHSSGFVIFFLPFLLICARAPAFASKSEASSKETVRCGRSKIEINIQWGSSCLFLCVWVCFILEADHSIPCSRLVSFCPLFVLFNICLCRFQGGRRSDLIAGNFDLRCVCDKKKESYLLPDTQRKKGSIAGKTNWLFFRS